MKIANHVKIQTVDHGAIIFDAREGNYAQVNLTGLRILEGVSSGLPAGDIVDGIVSEFEVSRPVVEKDVASYLTDMLDRGWIEVDTP